MFIHFYLKFNSISIYTDTSFNYFFICLRKREGRKPYRVGKLKLFIMKKIFTIMCAGILTLGVSAQTQFGATAGLNMSNVTGDDMDGNMKIGMHVGVSASFELSDAMNLKTGVLYSTKGTQDEEDGVKMEVNLSYIEIPVNLWELKLLYLVLMVCLTVQLI